jgi:KUP system potassium uptake protein
MSTNNEINLLSRYNSLKKFNIPSDFRFVLIDRIQNYDFDFPPREQLIMDIYAILKRFGISEVRSLGLDTSNVTIETVPLFIDKEAPQLLTRNGERKDKRYPVV